MQLENKSPEATLLPPPPHTLCYKEAIEWSQAYLVTSLVTINPTARLTHNSALVCNVYNSSGLLLPKEEANPSAGHPGMQPSDLGVSAWRPDHEHEYHVELIRAASQGTCGVGISGAGQSHLWVNGPSGLRRRDLTSAWHLVAHALSTQLVSAHSWSTWNIKPVRHAAARRPGLAMPLCLGEVGVRRATAQLRFPG